MDTPDTTAQRHVIDCRGLKLPSRRTPLIMGIVNITPDSFSDGGRFLEYDRAIEHAVMLAAAGADIVNIGGESTRPGSDPVSTEQEIARVQPVLEVLVAELPVPVSIDTRKAAVADAALSAGCHLVNDVSACRDESMPEVLCKHDAPVVIMHMRGDPKTMQERPHYHDVTEEVGRFLQDRAGYLVERGVSSERIIIDPGIGFGKRFRDNLELINRIGEIRSLGFPVLVGASRKRFLGELTDEGVEGRLAGSLAVAAKCYESGVDIVRVHDVKETRQLFTVLDALDNPGEYSADW